MTGELPTKTKDLRTAMLQGLILLGLCVPVFVPELVRMSNSALKNPEAAHVYAAPLLIFILLYRRRRELASGLSGGSVWGLALVLVAFVGVAVTEWFRYAYPKWTMMALATAGIILSVGGWRVLKLCMPVVLIMLIAIPVGARYYVRLIIGPETYTLDAVRIALDLLPGISVDLTGPDLQYIGEGGSGTIALGESNRGASLFLTYMTLTVFVTFANIRPFWQVVVMAAAAGPIALAANFLRLTIWGLVVIYGGSEPVSMVPRFAAIIGSQVSAYLMAVALLGILMMAVVESADQDSKEAGCAAVEA